MLLYEKNICFTFTNVSCTFKKVIPEISKIVLEGANVFPIIFSKEYFLEEEIKNIEKITNKKILNKIEDEKQDLIAVIPCSRRCYCKVSKWNK